MGNIEGDEPSGREIEILRLVATGAANKEIAQKLFISPNTVKVHMRNIFDKIGAASRTEAAMYAIKTGLLEMGGSNLYIEQGESSGEKILEGLPQTSPQLFLNKKNVLFMSIPFAVFILVFIFYLLFFQKKYPLELFFQQSEQTIETDWKTFMDLSVPRSGFAVVPIENTILIIGGQTIDGISGLVELIDIKNKGNKLLKNKPTPVTDVQAAMVQGKIYIPGGLTEKGPTNVLEIYDPQLDEWETGSNMPVPLSAYALVSYEGLLYLFGGWNGQKYVNQVLEYNPNTDLWRELLPMPIARGYASAVVAAGKIYVMGGYDGKKYLNLNHIFNPFTSEGEDSAWQSVSSLPEGRSGMGVINLTDTLYLLDGQDDSDDDMECMAYFPLTDEWAYMREFPKTNVYQSGIVTIGGKIFLLGGMIDGTPSAKIQSYQVLYSITIPIIIR